MTHCLDIGAQRVNGTCRPRLPSTLNAQPSTPSLYSDAAGVACSWHLVPWQQLSWAQSKPFLLQKALTETPTTTANHHLNSGFRMQLVGKGGYAAVRRCSDGLGWTHLPCRHPRPGVPWDHVEITCFSSGTETKAEPRRFPEPEFFVRQKSMSLCDSRLAVCWAGLCWKRGLCAPKRGVAEPRGFRQGNPYGGRLSGQLQAGGTRPPPPGPGGPAAAAPAPRSLGSSRFAQKSSEQQFFMQFLGEMRFSNKNGHFQENSSVLLRIPLSFLVLSRVGNQ